MLDDVLGQFADHGLEPAQPLTFGKLTRCKTTQDKGKEKNGWYVIHEHRTENNETLIFGSFGDWRSGESTKIKVKAGRMSQEERDVMRARQEEGKRRAAEIAANAARRAANRASGLFKRMPEKGRSAYLDRKQIVGMGVRYAPRSGAVLVPMSNVRDQIVGLQVIYPEKQPDTGRDKSYWPYGMSKEGAFHLIGPHPEPGEPVLVCEGYATGASLHMATSLTVAIAFDAGNLSGVAKAMRERFPGRALIVCRDDDWKTKRPNGEPWNPGEEKGSNAALIVGGQVVGPVFSGEREIKWTDFNDLHCAEGLDAVRRQVLSVVRPPAAGGWKDQLARTENGSLIAHMQNVELILGNDERWAGVITFSAFSSKIVKLRTPPYGGGTGDWGDIDDIRVMKWLAQQYNLRVKASSVIEAVSVVAHDNSFHPVRNYLNKLEWDRVPRLDTWLTTVMGVAQSGYSSKVGTWTMYHWGTGTAWSGYQPRAMMGACRAWYELVSQGRAVPPKLKAYAENWLAWLITFTKTSDGILPTDFPMTSVPQPELDGFTGHVTGLWLAGACLAGLAGSQVEGLDYLIEACVTELQNNYVVTPVPGQPMNGSWSPAVRLGTDNGMFFGFWAGEILRGLGLYVLYRNLGPGANIYGAPMPT
ncbi:toprim domain-containing protein [Pseudomonas sp. RL_5y_Pfl2_69]|uniref:toprim domain-containing protein n=1 Tax=Pseudomonas sp. RL_5y_Pfl2_69 TaxID=3088711 RepID=UPI0030D7EEE2